MLPIVLLFLVVQIVFSAPEQVHLSFRGNYSEMNVVWTTFDKDNSTLLYGSSPSSLTFSVEGSEKAWKTGGILRYTHEATMTDLLPSTTYWYKIGKRSFQFKTLPANPESFRVCVFGDLGYEHGNSTASIIRNGMAGMFDFIIHIGDIAYDLHSDAGRTGDNFMNALEPVISRIPYMVVAGNHEDDGNNFTNFQERFRMPANEFKDNQFYSFDLGPVHFVALSTEYYYYDSIGSERLLAQYNWLQKDLQNAASNRQRTPWIVSYLHRPFYCSSKGNNDCSDSDSALIRVGDSKKPGLEEVFLKYRLDVGFWGHALHIQNHVLFEMLVKRLPVRHFFLVHSSGIPSKHVLHLRSHRAIPTLRKHLFLLQELNSFLLQARKVEDCS